MSSPIPFPSAEQVPIVGQPCSLNAAFPTLSITCNCEAKQPLLLVGFGNLTVCPRCHRGFLLLAFSQDVRTGQPPQIHLDIVLNAPSVADGSKPS